MKNLGKRLTQLESMVPVGYDHIWDCCCDHGLLGINLLSRQAAPTVHFVDIVAKLINTVEQKLKVLFPKSKAWKTHCIDVATLPIDQYKGKHLIIIAGVGGDETIALVDKLHQQFSSHPVDFLLCPVYHQYAVREHLIKLNFALLDERLIKERKQYYEILHVSSSANRGRVIPPCGSLIWQTQSEGEFDVATEYLQRTLSHYQKSKRRLGDEAERKIQAYQNVLITQASIN